MAGKIKHMERSRRSYRSKDTAFRHFAMRASNSKYRHGIKKSLAKRFASFMALMKFNNRKQDK